MKRVALNLIAGVASNGKNALESVTAIPRGAQLYELACSPALVLGIAAGDVIEAPGDGTFKVVTRGMNLCIQIFGRAGLPELERALTPALEAIAGRLDGQEARALVYTVPVSAGFETVRRVLDGALRSVPTAKWYFGNVYDPVTNEPLNWWKT